MTEPTHEEDENRKQGDTQRQFKEGAGKGAIVVQKENSSPTAPLQSETDGNPSRNKCNDKVRDEKVILEKDMSEVNPSSVQGGKCKMEKKVARKQDGKRGQQADEAEPGVKSVQEQRAREDLKRQKGDLNLDALIDKKSNKEEGRQHKMDRQQTDHKKDRLDSPNKKAGIEEEGVMTGVFSPLGENSRSSAQPLSDTEGKLDRTQSKVDAIDPLTLEEPTQCEKTAILSKEKEDNQKQISEGNDRQVNRSHVVCSSHTNPQHREEHNVKSNPQHREEHNVKSSNTEGNDRGVNRSQVDCSSHSYP